jgi:phytoene dehydrogenase-like protein
MVEEWFESEQVQIAITRFASEAWVGPLEKGTGLNTFGFVPLIHRWGVGFAEGGSGALTEKLEACLKDSGAIIMVSSVAMQIKIESNTARALILSSGEEIRAKKAVVSNLNVKQLFLELLSPGELPFGFPEKIKNIRHSSFTAFNQALALNEAPRWQTGGDVDQACIVEITPLMDEPQGKHTLYLYHYEPYELAGGGAARWDEVRQEIADSVIQTSRKYITNLGSENILGRWMASPLDLERTNPAFINADCMHIGLFLSQYLSYRPLPGWGNYRTPVNNLYMCGASTHPGAGVTGGGRASVQVIMEDLGIDFKKVIGQ